MSDASESAPSQVKPSETGATAEEQAREIIAAIDVAGGTAAFSLAYEDTPAPHTVVLDAEIAAIVPILTRLVSAAKREGAIEALENAREIIARPRIADALRGLVVVPDFSHEMLCDLSDALSALREPK